MRGHYLSLPSPPVALSFHTSILFVSRQLNVYQSYTFIIIFLYNIYAMEGVGPFKG